MKSYLEIEVERAILQGKILANKSLRTNNKVNEVLLEIDIWDLQNKKIITKYRHQELNTEQYDLLSNSYQEKELKQKRELVREELTTKIHFLSKLSLVDAKNIKLPLKKSLRKYAFRIIAALGVIASIFAVMNDGFGINVPKIIDYFTLSGDAKLISDLKHSDQDFKIVVLPFSPDKDCINELTNYEKILTTRLRSKAKEENLQLEAVYLEEQACPVTEELILDLGQKSTADLFLWGEYEEDCEDPTKIKIKYAFVKSNEWLEQDYYESEKSELDDIELLKEGYLQRELDELIYFSLALSALKRAEWEKVDTYIRNTSAMDSLARVKDPLKSTVYNILLRIHMTRMFKRQGSELAPYDIMSKAEKIALSFHFLKNYKQAIKYYKIADAETVEEHYSGIIAQLYFNLGNYKMARKLVDDLKRRGKPVYKELEIKVLHKTGEHEKSLALIDENMKKEGLKSLSDFNALCLKRRILNDLGRTQEAERMLLDIILHPEYDDYEFRDTSWAIDFILMRMQ